MSYVIAIVHDLPDDVRHILSYAVDDRGERVEYDTAAEASALVDDLISSYRVYMSGERTVPDYLIVDADVPSALADGSAMEYDLSGNTCGGCGGCLDCNRAIVAQDIAFLRRHAINREAVR